MKITIRIFLFLMLMISFSCEEQGFFVKCPDCEAEEPKKATLEANLEMTVFTGAVIKIYEGNIEDNILVSTTEYYSQTFRTEVTINKKYTVTATYFLDGNYYTAVDSATPRVRYEKDQCTDPCYFVYDRKVNLRIKGH